MTTSTKRHTVRIKAPFYSDGRHAGLHRYLDTEFIDHFCGDVKHQRFDSPQFSAWLEEECHSRHDDKPVLRLPMHRAFHIFCCEAFCEQMGEPALCPKRIASAGFVIRRVGKGKEMAWMLEEGEPRGWEEAPTAFRDPDIHRRLCAAGVLHKRAEEPAYSGEEVHPLHVLNTVTADGRRHTLLYGFVPLGGFYYHRNTAVPFNESSVTAVLEAAGAQLPWPFGFRQPYDGAWLPAHSRPVDQGRPTGALFELLFLLVNRYHLGEAGIEENQALKALCQRIWFYDTSTFPADLQHVTFSDATRDSFKAHRKYSLWSYLEACFQKDEDNPLVRWLVGQEDTVETAKRTHQASLLAKLPRSSGAGTLSYSLFMDAADAQEMRALMGQRLKDQALSKVREIPLPKFGQESGDVFAIVPFVRFRDKEKREQIQWADARARSVLFRVAAPFDPMASRPSLIQIPSLTDLKRGLAKGASMLMPADTFNLLSALKLKEGASPDAVPEEAPGPGLGIQWICSFSLPVVTLVAMILLMIIISLLNIVFFWMPWVRICLPFPKIEK